MRGSDTGPWDELCAFSAFWVGLLYDANSLDAAWDYVKNWTQEEREQLRRDVPQYGLHTRFQGRLLRHIARDILEISRQGLKARARLNGHGESETIFLQPLDEFVRTGMNNADLLVQKFLGEWGGDISPVYKESAY